MNITVAGVGYVGLAQAVLLAQHNAVTAVTTTPAKAEQINRGVSPIVDAEIGKTQRFCNWFTSWFGVLLGRPIGHDCPSVTLIFAHVTWSLLPRERPELDWAL